MWDNVRSIRPRQRPTISVVNYVPVTLRPSNRVRLGGPLMASPFPPSFLFWPWPFTAFASFTAFGLSVSLSSLGTNSITSFFPLFSTLCLATFLSPSISIFSSLSHVLPFRRYTCPIQLFLLSLLPPPPPLHTTHHTPLDVVSLSYI